MQRQGEFICELLSRARGKGPEAWNVEGRAAALTSSIVCATYYLLLLTSYYLLLTTYYCSHILNIVCLSEAMLLALVHLERTGQPLGKECGMHQLGLIGRDDLIFRTLEQ